MELFQNLRKLAVALVYMAWPHEEFAVDRYDNWTQGCISMKNEDVEELYSMVKPGTK